MDYFSQGPSRRSSVTQDQQPPPPQAAPTGRRPPGFPSYESLRAPSAIRIRRLPSSIGSPLSRPVSHEASGAGRPPSAGSDHSTGGGGGGRRRSFSAPQHYAGDATTTTTATGPEAARLNEPPPHMPAISEGFPTTPGAQARPATASAHMGSTASGAPHSTAQHPGRLRGMSSPMHRMRSHTSATNHSRQMRPAESDEYDNDVIDLLDLIDPEVRTIGTLTNLQNSLFVPDLGSLVNRRPTYELTSRRDRANSRPGSGEGIDRRYRPRADTRASRLSQRASQLDPIPQDRLELDDLSAPPHPPSTETTRKRRVSIGSELSDSRYAVLPHGVSLEGWSEADVDELNDHVRHLLHSRREGFKRGWRGFRKYISRPLGLFVFLYATSVTLFGTAWVFALIGWIYVGSHDRQEYIIDVIDNVLVALFALMGDGLAPFRAVDTYHMCFIAHYHHLTWRLRQEKQLPALVDRNDLPDRHVDAAVLEDALDKEETAEYSVLTPRQQKRLQYHQAKFSKSHTFYKPHETATHHAFPLRLLVAVVTLLDFHSIFQVALGTCTWSINYRVRPQALTATILACSLTCNIVAGILISVGDHKTRKKDVLERMFRQALTEEALRRMARTRDRGAVALAVDPTRLVSEDLRETLRDVTGKDAEAIQEEQQRRKSEGEGLKSSEEEEDSPKGDSPERPPAPMSPSSKVKRKPLDGGSKGTGADS